MDCASADGVGMNTFYSTCVLSKAERKLKCKFVYYEPSSSCLPKVGYSKYICCIVSLYSYSSIHPL